MKHLIEQIDNIISITEGILLKKKGVKKLKTKGEETQNVTSYDIMKNGKKVGTAEYEDYFGTMFANIKGEKTPQIDVRTDPQSAINSFLKAKRGQKFAKLLR